MLSKSTHASNESSHALGASYLSFQEAQEFLNVKESWLRNAVFKKEIPFHKFNRLIRFDMNDLLLWTLKNKVER